jgi:hypothetical protein
MAFVSEAEKDLVRTLAVQQQRTEAFIVRKAIEQYAKLLGIEATVQEPMGRNRPLTADHRRKISESMIRRRQKAEVAA